MNADIKVRIGCIYLDCSTKEFHKLESMPLDRDIIDYIEKQLRDGNKVTITVKGFDFKVQGYKVTTDNSLILGIRPSAPFTILPYYLDQHLQMRKDDRKNTPDFESLTRYLIFVLETSL